MFPPKICNYYAYHITISCPNVPFLKPRTNKRDGTNLFLNLFRYHKSLSLVDWPIADTSSAKLLMCLLRQIL